MSNLGLAKYRKVDTRIWLDDKFMSLTRDEQLIWLYMLTNDRTTVLPGIYRINQAIIAAEMRMPIETVSEGFRNGLGTLSKANWPLSLVWILNAYRYNSPENLNVVKGWADVARDLPDCELKTEAIQTLTEYLGTLSKPYRDCFETRAKPFRNQEQEQEQERIPKVPSPSARVDAHQKASERSGTDDFELFWKAYPRRVGKGAACKAWKKTGSPASTLALILEALQWQSRSPDWTKDGGQFIPHPATYLNQRRWEDSPMNAYKPYRPIVPAPQVVRPMSSEEKARIEKSWKGGEDE